MTGDAPIDARDLRCPLPIIRLAAAARGQSPGTTLTLLTTDPAAVPDVAAWCRMRGHDLLSQQIEPSAGPSAGSSADAAPPVLRHVIRLN